MTCNGNGDACTNGRNGTGNSTQQQRLQHGVRGRGRRRRARSPRAAQRSRCRRGAPCCGRACTGAATRTTARATRCASPRRSAGYATLTATQTRRERHGLPGLHRRHRARAGGRQRHLHRGQRALHHRRQRVRRLVAGGGVPRQPLPLRNLVVFDGYASVAPGATVNVQRQRLRHAARRRREHAAGRGGGRGRPRATPATRSG